MRDRDRSPTGSSSRGSPGDAFWFLGLNNQIVTVLPSQGIVAVRMGKKPPANAPFSHTELTQGVLGALTSGASSN